MSLPKDGEYYATHTLLGSTEILPDGSTRSRDINRRYIYRWPDSKTLFAFNVDFQEWTAEDEKKLQAKLDELNGKTTE